MLEKQMKQSVYTGYLKNEEGFSFLSLFIMITIMSITLPLIGYLLQSANNISSNYNNLYTQQFFQFLRDEVIQSNEFTVADDKLLLTQGSTTAKIEQYGNVVRRQVDGKGHEILLRDIENITFNHIPHGVQLSITNSTGENYEKTIIHYQ